MPLPEFIARPRPWRTLLLWAWLIFWAGYLAAETLSWTEPLDGLGFGLRQSPLVLLVFAALMPPIIMLATAIWKWRKWRPEFHTLCALYPPVVFAVMAVVVTLNHRAEPSGRFQKAYGGGLPANVRELRTFFSRSGFWAPQDAFAFQTTPVETETLLAAHPFAAATDGLRAWPPGAASVLAQTIGRGWPDPQAWPGLKTYVCDDEKTRRHFALMADGAMTKVFIVVWSD